HMGKTHTSCLCYVRLPRGKVKGTGPSASKGCICMNTINHWINNAYTEGAETTVERTDVTNPATGEVSGQVAMAGNATVDEAVAAAKAAFPAWRDTSLSKRTQVLFRYRELLNERKEELAQLISAEHG